MDEQVDLEQVIADSVNDSVNDVDTTDLDATLDASPDPVPEADPAPEAQAEESAEVPSPASQEAAAAVVVEPQDEFEKIAGVPKIGVGGRENRIPYSRVKAITEKSNRELAELAVGRQLTKDEKPSEVLKTHVAQIPELQAKTQDYEARLETVSRFEQVMETDPEKFLGMLQKLPVYKDFFEFVQKAVDNAAGQKQSEAVAEPVDPFSTMPEPDELLNDGSKVYSMEGLKGLLAWQAQQTETKVVSQYEQKLKELDDRYTPLKKDWEQQRYIQATLPTIQKKIEEARKWTLFNESEADILKKLQDDPNISLEGAYREVVFPKLLADRDKIRQDIIRDVQKAPVSSAVPARAATRPGAPASAGPRDIEDIIREQVESLKR